MLVFNLSQDALGGGNLSLGQVDSRVAAARLQRRCSLTALHRSDQSGAPFLSATISSLVSPFSLTISTLFINSSPLHEHDVFLFPSLHDTGGLAVLEAMCAGLPAVCLDVAGPGALVREQCGVKVPLGSRGEVILGLAKASDYDWDRKGELMNRLYGSVFQSDRHDTGSNVPQSPPLCRTRSQQSKHNNHENDIAN
jgi:hypothetical protein